MTLLQNQKDFFNSGKTKDISFRISALEKLEMIISDNESLLLDALFKDLHKSSTESFTSEIAYVLKEINLIKNKLKKWNKPVKVRTKLINQPGKSYIINEPYGIVLIIGPWNYPFGLIFSPLIGAVAAGNCVVIKPSEIAKHTSDLIADLIIKNFPENYIAVVKGDGSVTQSLINENISYIFFTGSTHTGKKILKSASEYLIPVTLELGGKNPCIVDNETDMDVTARRIIWGKFFNAGQTCIAPDYLLVHKEIFNEFLGKLIEILHEFYSEINKDSKDYSHIINLTHFNRLVELLSEGNIQFGGDINKDNLFISPTIITNLNYDSKLMTEEIFGPILPVLQYNNLDEEIQKLKNLPKPLTIYCFSKNKSKQDKIILETSSGSVCINGTIHTIMTIDMPFGGIGQSGMGYYHGFYSYEIFSHRKSVLKKSFLFDLKAIYPPYKTKLSLLKKIIKILY